MARSDEAAEKVAETRAEVVRTSLETVGVNELAGADVVVHAAALATDWAPSEAFHRTNVVGTIRMLGAARTAGVRKFIHISSDSVLFAGSHLRDVDEQTPYPMRSPFPYAATKAEAEREVIAANMPDAGFETVVLRPILVWGPGDQTTLPEIAEIVENGSWIWVSGGRTKVNTTHIDNLVLATELAITNGRGGEIYFITDGEISELRTFLTAYAATAGVALEGPSVPRALAKALAWSIETGWRVFRPGMEPPVSRFAVATFASDVYVKSTKARDELGYVPVMDVTTGLRRLS